MSKKAIELILNQELPTAATAARTSTVCEPSVANDGKHIIVTGNWFAARSSDAGKTWVHLDPLSYFPASIGKFCCDQTVIYDPTRDLIVWLLQYTKTAQGNILRVCVKRGGDLSDDNWVYWDLKPSAFDAGWKSDWFDYNHAALTRNMLYVGTNMYSIAGDQFVRTVVLRLPLDDLAQAGQPRTEFFATSEVGSVRCTQGARETMYFAAHAGPNTLRVFAWPEGAPRPSARDVRIGPTFPPRMSAPGPDGNDWLGRLDTRITGGYYVDGMIGFLWSSNRSGTLRPFPFVRVVRLALPNFARVDEPDIWSPDHAYAYPDACPNDYGQIGITLYSGGGRLHPSHVVGVFDDQRSAWDLETTVNGTHGPVDGKWGDYLTCRRHSPDGLSWICTGAALDGGSTRTDLRPRIVHFSLVNHAPAAVRWLGL